MQPIEKTKRKYFTKAQKFKILNENESGGMNHSELARKHGIHPITLFKWKREMGPMKSTVQPDYSEILEENEALKLQIENLKKALGELAVEKQILKTANDILQRDSRKKKLKSLRKSSKR